MPRAGDLRVSGPSFSPVFRFSKVPPPRCRTARPLKNVLPRTVPRKLLGVICPCPGEKAVSHEFGPSLNAPVPQSPAQGRPLIHPPGQKSGGSRLRQRACRTESDLPQFPRSVTVRQEGPGKEALPTFFPAPGRKFRKRSEGTGYAGAFRLHRARRDSA